MRLAGGNPRALVSGIDELPGKVNYLVGSDRGQWKTGIPTFAKVKYQGVYSGIDLVYYGNQGHLEYDFIIAPGADPRVIAMNFEGAGRLEVDDNGDLVLKAGSSSLRQHKAGDLPGSAGAQAACFWGVCSQRPAPSGLSGRCL